MPLRAFFSIASLVLGLCGVASGVARDYSSALFLSTAAIVSSALYWIFTYLERNTNP